MTAHGLPQASGPGRHEHAHAHAQVHDPRLEAAERAVADAERAASNEWSVLVRPRGSRKTYVRQILIDAAIALVALLIIALLS